MVSRLSMIVIALLLIGFFTPGGIKFSDMTESSGLSSSLSGMMGHSAAWGDYDHDGLLDLFIAGFCDRPPENYGAAKKPAPATILRQVSNGKFQIGKISPQFCGRSSFALFVDLNTDQFPELLVSNNVRNSKKPNPAQQISSKLYGNEKGTLKEVPFDSGVLSARNIAVFDFDGDGLLDLFVVEDPFNQKAYRHGSVLLKNLGNMKFQNYNAAAGIPNEVYGLGMAVADLNEDGVADFFVTYSNRLFLSQSNHTYREVPELNQTFRWNATDTEDWPSGAAFGDLNLDGKLDLVIANHHAPAHNRIFLTQGVRNGIPSFLDVTKAAGIEAAVPVKSPHVEIQDFDNDGLPDIYTSAAYQDKNDVIPLIYRNIGFGNGTIPKFQASIDFKQPMIYFPAGPTADFDRDGKIDLFLVSWEPTSSSRLLRNVTSGGNWLEITAPVGTKLQLFSNRKLVGNQQLYPGFGFSSGQPPIAHFGLGKLDSVDIEAILPGGRSIKKTVRANRIIDVQK